MRKTRLFTPGPTPLIPQAQEAMAGSIPHHRTEQFTRLLARTRHNLQTVFKTDRDVVILASSGTGAMESAVASLLSSRDHALTVVAGKFGERWSEICEVHGIPFTELKKENGQAATAEEIGRLLHANPAINTVLIQGCETSTATAHDLETIALQTRRDHPEVLIVVDAITALLTQPVETDRWDLDIVISGSQKSFGLPPGLSFLSVSSRALERMESGRSSSYYYDLQREVMSQRKGQTAFTPAISLIIGLDRALTEILDQGPDKISSEAELMARCTRKGLQELGFKLLSSSPANALTAAFPPTGVTAPDLVKELELGFGIKVASGQGELKTEIIRIAHLGYFDLLDVLSVLGAIELCLLKLGVAVNLGAGVQAALLEATRVEEYASNP